MMIRRLVSIGACAALSALWQGVAWGATEYSDTVLVSGPESLRVFELPFDAPGTYTVTATDHEWLNTPLQALSFGVFSSTQPVATRVGAGTLEFYKAGAGRVYLQLYARTLTPRYAGLIGVKGAAVVVVPLPASFGLLLSALCVALAPKLRRWLQNALGVRVAQAV